MIGGEGKASLLRSTLGALAETMALAGSLGDNIRPSPN
jgi:hypothetical protein